MNSFESCRLKRQKTGIVDFLDFFSFWFSNYGCLRKAPGSVKRDEGIARNYLVPKFGSLPIEEFQTEEIEAWLLNVKGSAQLSPKSCNDILGLLRKVLNDAVRWGYIPDNPAVRVAKLRRPERDFKFWPIEVVQEFLLRTEIEVKYPKNYAVCKVALYTGMRRGEIQGLKWDCVDLSRRQITIKRTYERISKSIIETTKNRKIRRIPINGSLEVLLNSLKHQSNRENLVLPWIHPDRYYSVFQKICREFDLPKITFHDLRHTFASHFMMAGGNIYDLKRLLGHNSVTTTEMYAHLEPDYLSNKTDILHY